MNEKISIEKLLTDRRKCILIDVRSPSEYQQGHIPDAINLPLFSDEERVVIGTLYKQKSKEEAMLKALDYYSPNMKVIIEQLIKIQNEKRLAGASDEEINSVVVHCWRGGMRSGVVCWMLNLFDINTYQIIGGYKSFRKWCLNYFNTDFNIKVLGGNTGSAKTKIIHELKKRNDQVIDLEALANHKGSAFGAMDENIFHTQEQFENNLALNLSSLNTQQVIWLEDESQRIGNNQIPGGLWKQMREAELFYFNIPFEVRLNNIVEEYGKTPKQKLIDATVRIRKKLGGLQMQETIEYLDKNNFHAAFAVLLKYYDKLYKQATSKRESGSIIMMNSDTCNAQINASILLKKNYDRKL